jgi:glyoxalase family protein
MGHHIMGLHHITALIRDTQRTKNFYSKVLGLRSGEVSLRCDTVNSCDFHFGTESGSAGAGLTFCPRPLEMVGEHGCGQATEIGYSVPAGSLDFWLKRFDEYHVICSQPNEKFGEFYIPFMDPNGLKSELVVSREPDSRPPCDTAFVPHDMAIRGFHNVTLTLACHCATAILLTEVLGYRLEEQRGNRFRYATGTGLAAGFVDILEMPGESGGFGGSGTVHHVAFRVQDGASMRRFREQLTVHGLELSPAPEQPLVRSMSFREPGGVLFELVTAPPGLLVDDLRTQSYCN